VSAPTDLSDNKIGDSYWGTDCFLVSLVSLPLIACFLVSESVGHPSRLSGSRSSLRFPVLFQNFL
jgi:hypothetical protein